MSRPTNRIRRGLVAAASVALVLSVASVRAEAASSCISTAPTPTNECTAGYPASACECGSGTGTNCEVPWDNYYWSQQPVAVQALRGMANPAALAQELTDQGYCIDYVTMVEGWDPASTTCMRQIYGYTWVPSQNQPQVQVAPGLEYPPNPALQYNPGLFPPGSISVPAAEASCPAYAQSWNTPSSAPICNGQPSPTCGTGYYWSGTCQENPVVGWSGSCLPGSPPAAQSKASGPVVGILEYQNIYATGPGDSLSAHPVGSTYTNAQGTFTKTVVNGLFGPEYFWTLN